MNLEWFTNLKKLLTSQKKGSHLESSAKNLAVNENYNISFTAANTDSDGRTIHKDFHEKNKETVQNILKQKTIPLIKESEKVLGIDLKDILHIKYYPGHPSHFHGMEMIFQNKDSLTDGSSTKDLHGQMTIMLGLGSTTSLSKQINEIDFLVPHEGTHVLFDTEYLKNKSGYSKDLDTKIPFNDKEGFFYAYQHFQEYIANTVTALVIGKEKVIEHFTAFPDDTSLYHPSSEQTIFAIENDIFKQVAITNIDKVKTALSNNQNFNSWQDFVDHKETYLSLQKSIIERT